MTTDRFRKINDIIQSPTVIDGKHESLFKSREVLNLVRQMLERWDSRDTILMLIEFFYNNNMCVQLKEYDNSSS